MLCPRDGSKLVPHTEQTRSAFIDHGISHCPDCSGMLLNAEAAENSMTESKLKKMHEAFASDSGDIDLALPLLRIEDESEEYCFQENKRHGYGAHRDRRLSRLQHLLVRCRGASENSQSE